MIGGWRPWERLKAARRLTGQARREGGEPPPDLLRRLLDDVPDRPAMAYVPAPADGGRRTLSRRWLAAASVAAALAAGVIGLRVWERQLRWGGKALAPREAADRPTGEALSERPLPGSGQPGSQASPSPVMAPAPGSVVPEAQRSRGASPAPAEPRPEARKRLAAVGYAGAGSAAAGSAAARSAAAGSAAARSAAAGSAAAGPAAAGPAPVPQDGASLKAPSPAPASAIPPRASRWVPPAASPREPAASPPVALPGAAAAPPPAPESPGAAGNRRAESEPTAGSEAVAAPAAPRPAVPAQGAARPAIPGLSGRVAKAQPVVAEAEEAGRPATATSGWLHSSFGIDLGAGTGSYRRLRRELLDEGRLPRGAAVRAGELASAFDLAARTPAAGGPELLAEGAPLPSARGAYLLRFDARGLAPPSGLDAVEVDFDPAVVAHFQRVGVTVHRGAAAALYEIELRQPVARAWAGMVAAVPPSSLPRPADVRRKAAAPRPATGEGPGPGATRPAAAPAPAGPASVAAGIPAAAPGATPRDETGGGSDRVVAVLRAVSSERPGAAVEAVRAERVVRASDLRPALDAASPALRASVLAVELARALAASDPAPRLRRLQAQAQALAASLPDDPKAAELALLIRRAADLTAATGGTSRPP